VPRRESMALRFPGFVRHARLHLSGVALLGIIRTQGAGYLFSHALIQEAVYGSAFESDPGHARCPCRLTIHLELPRCHYNFLRPHAGLRFGRDTRTPAMVARISDGVMSFRDIFAPTSINS